MFAGRRKELQETVSNWNNNSPNLSRTGSLRNPNVRGQENKIIKKNLIIIYITQ